LYGTRVSSINIILDEDKDRNDNSQQPPAQRADSECSYEPDDTYEIPAPMTAAPSSTRGCLQTTPETARPLKDDHSPGPLVADSGSESSYLRVMRVVEEATGDEEEEVTLTIPEVKIVQEDKPRTCKGDDEARSRKWGGWWLPWRRRQDGGGGGESAVSANAQAAVCEASEVMMATQGQEEDYIIPLPLESGKRMKINLQNGYIHSCLINPNPDGWGHI
jgi:hypothetical protein